MAEPKTVDVGEAEAHLSNLLARVRTGEEVIIAKDGQPIARLSPIKEPMNRRVPGGAQGLIVVPDDFDDPLPPELQRYFDG